MHPLCLSAGYKLVLALLMGIAFGVVFSKSGFLNPDAVRNALRLKNGRMLKTLLLAMGLGTALFYLTRKLGLTEIQVRPGYLWGSVFGGVCCGAGLALTGLAATTVSGALGEGRIHALWTVAGMILGTVTVNAVVELLSKTVYNFQKMDSPPEPAVFWDVSNPALYVLGGMAFLLILVHWTAGDKEE